MAGRSRIAERANISTSEFMSTTEARPQGSDPPLPAELAPLPIVLGPTGSGKSELAIAIAVALGAEIVNCDSIQVYRGFDIGSAKVPEGKRRGIPHHLIDVVDPGTLFTAGDYIALARPLLREIRARRRIPIIVGGTGFYLRALLEGLSPGPARSASVRARLMERERKRPSSLHRILTRLDPAVAARIHANDKNKTIRALEIRLLEGRPASRLFLEGKSSLSGYSTIKLGLDPPRELLYARLDARTRTIFAQGLLDEVSSLLGNGVPADAKPFESLGYKQALQVVHGQSTLEEAIQSTETETRNYAKRQMTWFRKEAGVQWLSGFGDDPHIQERAIALVRESLGALRR